MPLRPAPSRTAKARYGLVAESIDRTSTRAEFGLPYAGTRTSAERLRCPQHTYAGDSVMRSGSACGNNRSALVRVPPTKKGKRDSTRIEYRAPDPAANPYLAFAVMLGAGLKGIEQGYELPPGAEDDVWALSPAERKALGYQPLPQNLSEAIDVLSGSELVAEVLGEHVFDFFLRNKRQEWEEFRHQVTPYERQRYLGLM